jgi:DNA (cytosine-5)-methyltransferase 1
MNVLDLFSGIGGFSLGLERAGFKTVAFCEAGAFQRAVLRKHWPDVKIYEDIRNLSSQHLTADGISVDAICGGFPCQDISLAGAGAGIEGSRSGLWGDYARLVGELRPSYVIVENVSALLGRGLGRVLGDLAAVGYDAEWHCIPACYVGAWHERDRVWIVAYPQSVNAGGAPRPILRQHHLSLELGRGFARWPGRSNLPKSRFRRDDDGLPRKLDRNVALGNAVVPQIPEIIGRAIMNATNNF